jgi:predicted nucleic acid-binding protein
MHYIDTSVLAAFYVPELLSERAEDFLLSCPQPAISALTKVEFASALACRIRMGELSKGDGERLTALFQNHLDGGVYTRLSLSEEHFLLAWKWISSWQMALKSLDALHLALAAAENLTMVTADRQMARAAESLTVKVLLLE